MVVQEVVKMWNDHFKEILNSDNSANESAEFVEHSIDCKDKYLGTEMPIMFCCFADTASSKAALEQGPRA